MCPHTLEPSHTSFHSAESACLAGLASRCRFRRYRESVPLRMEPHAAPLHAFLLVARGCADTIGFDCSTSSQKSRRVAPPDYPSQLCRNIEALNQATFEGP